MAKKMDISNEKLLPWDEYKDKDPNQALESIYNHIWALAHKMCAWYWISIRTKRRSSFVVRGIAFCLGAVGSTLPIVAGIPGNNEHKLYLTQGAIILIAIAGLMVLADRVFGWSSGWIRYITTVMTMENLTRSFELEWAKLFIEKTASLDSTDVKAMFDLAQKLEQGLTKLQAEETGQWVAEFNSGTAILESMIKAQQDETQKKPAGPLVGPAPGTNSGQPVTTP